MLVRNYEMPWRPAFEVYAAAAWFVSAIIMYAVMSFTDLPAAPFWLMFWVSAWFFLWRGQQGYRLLSLKLSLSGRGLEYIKPARVVRKFMKHDMKQIWIGYGFKWHPVHSQRVYEIIKTNVTDLTVPKWFMKLHGALFGVTYASDDAIGVPWIHGVEPNETDVYVPSGNFEGHLQILGASRSGKTRLLEVLTTQSIHRGDVVMILDPKGDKDWENRARKECERAGRPFMYFHPAFPSKSIRIDTMASWSRLTQLATRVSSLIPSETGADAFTAFGWSAINKITQGCVMIDERPSLVKMRRHIEHGPEALLEKVLEAHFKIVQPTKWEAMTAPLIELVRKAGSKTGYPEMDAYLRYYKSEIADKYPSDIVSGLVSLQEHNREHFGKMIANLIPILDMLTSGELGKLLSPDADDIGDDRPILDIERIIKGGYVAYFNFDTLSDKTVGNAICSILLADAAAVAGGIYNYGKHNDRKISIYVDEAANAVSDSLIEMLNKGGGAGYSITLATQTLADYTAKLGSEDKARMLLGNCNNLIALRSRDRPTQDYVVETIGKAWIQSLQTTIGTTASSEKSIAHFSGGVSERMSETLEDAFPPELLGRLPNWQYVGLFAGGDFIKGRVPIMQD